MLSENSSLIVNTVSFEDDEIIDEFADQSEKIENKILIHSKNEHCDVSLVNKSNNEFEYLKRKKWKYIYEEQESNIESNFLKIEKKLQQNIIIIFTENLKQFSLKKILDNYDPSDNKFSIGTLNSLKDLIERTYYFSKINEENMKSDNIRLKKMVFKYRKLKKDGNSFYRGVIFNFLENVIFSKNILLMKEILNLFDEKISEENPKIKEKNFLLNALKHIEKNKVLNILYIIIHYMVIYYKEKKELDITELTPYIILIKAFLISNEFDEGIIFFTRYLIYEYIKDNENKFISEKKKIKISDIINKKNPEEFYEQLITMGSEANTDPIYSDVVPFIFNCALDVLIYRTNNGSSVIEKIEYRNEKITEYEINLIFREKDFDIFYKDYFYNKNYNDLDNFIYEENNNKNKNNSGNEFSIFNPKVKSINLNRQISSQYPAVMPLQNLLLSSIKENEQNEVSSSIIKFNLNGDGNDIDYFKGKIFTNESNNKIKPIKKERLSKKSNSTREIKLTESSISAIMKRGERCHRNGCPNRIMKENALNLCHDCKMTEIKSFMLQIYLTYLQLDINKNCKKILKEYFSKTECPVDIKNNLSIMEIIRESEFNFDELFDNIKTSICLICGKNLEEENYFFTLPCKCRLCSKKCFDIYIKLVDEKNEKVLIKGKGIDNGEIIVMPMTECPCGYEYKLKDFLNMIKELKKRKMNSSIDIYVNQIKNNWKWNCIFCRGHFRKKYQYINIFFKDYNLDDKITNKIEFKHLACKKCALKENIDENLLNNENRKFLCNFCESEHSIVQIKNIDDKNKIDSDCIII